MGFRPEPTQYMLNFDGTFLEGLHVKVGCCTMEEFNTMLRKSGPLDMSNAADLNDEASAMFLRYVSQWDLEDEAGNPVPKTLEGLNSQEQRIVAALITAWQVAMVTVPKASSETSPDGKISEELSLALASESANPGNWPKPSK